jgi:hypothetical protein
MAKSFLAICSCGLLGRAAETDAETEQTESRTEKSHEPVQYRYLPIQGLQQIRILKLAPGRDDEPLAGQLETVDLGDKTAYEALSYEWGSPRTAHRILLGHGAELWITDSLHNALRDLRRRTRGEGSRAIWADAICIDQNNLDEREAQVSVMGKIYSNAKRVVTYTGPEKDNSSLAIDFALELVQQVTSGSGRQKKRSVTEADILEPGLSTKSDARCAALRRLLLRGWSGRCWCAQEFLSNKTVIVMCGKRSIRSDLIPDVVSLCIRRRLPVSLLPDMEEDPKSLKECLLNLRTMRKGLLFESWCPVLEELLPMMHPFQASDPRDKVYALLGQAYDFKGISLPIDYNCPVEELYINVARQILNRSTALQILYSNNGRKYYNLPSWVPDWSTWRFGHNGTSVDHVFSACGPTSPKLRVLDTANRLEISGCLISKITFLTENIGQFYESHECPDRGAWLSDQLALLNHHGPYAENSETPDDMLWRTLVSDMTFVEDKAGKELAAQYEAHLSATEESPWTKKDMARQFCDAVRRRSRYRRLCLTERNFFGAVPDEAAVGDWVCMFHGGKYLFVVRPSGLDYTYVGHAYVHGLMSGEVLAMDWYQPRKFTLI